MNKFVVRNCPALRWGRKKFKVCYEGNKETKCCDIDDCIIKQIVELCKEAKDNLYCPTDRYLFASEILDFLEIEDVE